MHRRRTFVQAVVLYVGATLGCALLRPAVAPQVAAEDAGSKTVEATEPVPSPFVRSVTVEPQETAAAAPAADEPYRLGVEDEITILVYGEPELTTTQRIRPDGLVAVPLMGDVRASGRAPDELRETIRSGLKRYVADPAVTVIVASFNSLRAGVLGEVKQPGIIQLASRMTLADAVARAGGFTADADLAGAFLLREGRMAPVDFQRLFRQGDLGQNVMLRPQDLVYVPSFRTKKAFVLGEVQRPAVVTLTPDLSLVESISASGGFTTGARSEGVFLIRGGVAESNVLEVDVRGILREGHIADNVPLKHGDIVYVPKTTFASIADVFDDVRKILGPIVLAESGIILGPAAWSVLATGETPVRQPINISP